MKKEKVNELLTEIRKHDASNTFAVFRYDGEQQNELAVKLNENVKKRYSTLSDEQIYKIVENSPDDLDIKLVIETIVMSLAEEASKEPEITNAFKNIVDVYDENTWQEINRLFRLVQYLRLIMVKDQLRFTDLNDRIGPRVVNDFITESAKWDQDTLKELVDDHWEKVDYMIFLCCYIIHQMLLNGILLAYPMEAMIRLILNHFYCERSVISVMLNLGENKFSFTQEQMEQKCTVEFVE